MPEDEAQTLCEAETRSVLGEPAVSIEPLPHGRRTTATREVWRVRTAHTGAVVKVVSTDPFAAGVPGADRATHPYYVAREPLLYQRGVAELYSDAGIAMPRLFAAVERPGAVALWLEDLDGSSGRDLTVADYAAAGRRLGRAEGSERTLTRSASDGWSDNFLGVYLASWNDVGWERIDDDDVWNAPLIRVHFPPALRAELLQLCRDRHELLTWTTRLPRTICHHDVWPNNVFASDDHTTFIDWAFAGHGHIGSDPGNLVTDSCGDLLQPSALLPELDAVTFDAYRAGLRDAGWNGDVRAARLGMCLMAAKWSWLVPHMLNLAANDHHAVYGDASVSSDELFSERAAMLAFNAWLASEARALADQLGISRPR